MKRAICLILICLMLGGCELSESGAPVGVDAPTDAEAPRAALDDISFVYYPDDEQNPLLSKNATNQKLNRAVYLPLVTFDENLEVQYGCAVSHTAEGNTLFFVLDSARRFSDGTPLTGSIVKSCFDAVLAAPESPYYEQLSNVASVTAASGGVTVTLKSPDPAALYCMDIPIVLSDGKTFYGCGDYRFSEVNDALALVPNDQNNGSTGIQTVYLLEPKADGELTDMFNSGVLDILPTDLLPEGVFSASRSYEVRSYLTRRMLFVGVNSKGTLADAKLRAAFGKMLPRESIVKNVLMNHGKAATHPFYPAYGDLPAETTPETEEILAAFSDAGCTVQNGGVTLADGTFSITVLTPEIGTLAAAAEQIRTAAWTYGIEVKIESVSTEAFTERLESGNFDCYLADYELPRNMDPTALYATAGAHNYGGFSDPKLDAAFADYRSGQISLADYLAVFDGDSPILPLAFAANTLYLTEGVTADNTLSFSAPLGNLSAWTLS